MCTRRRVSPSEVHSSKRCTRRQVHPRAREVVGMVPPTAKLPRRKGVIAKLFKCFSMVSGVSGAVPRVSLRRRSFGAGCASAAFRTCSRAWFPMPGARPRVSLRRKSCGAGTGYPGTIGDCRRTLVGDICDKSDFQRCLDSKKCKLRKVLYFSHGFFSLPNFNLQHLKPIEHWSFANSTERAR